MTQPAVTLPTAAAQQQAAAEVFAQYEPQLYEAYLEMMTGWLAAVRAAIFAGGVARLGLVPDPMKVFSQTPKWHDLTEKYTEKVAEDVLAAPYRDLFADGTLFESRPFVRNWIAARANRLQRVPDEVFGAVAQIIDSATTNGATIPDVTKQVDELLDASGADKWKNRARTVARTEVVGAYNGGLHDAFAMIVEADPDTRYVKRWLATEDHRTRPDHREADGQVVPWGQPFDVGGFQMMYPHDPAGPPQEVINCRCTMLLEIENEPTSMENRGYKKTSSLSADATRADVEEHLHAQYRQYLTLFQTACTDGQFCMETHKPGLCKGQKRGQTEPGQPDATKKNPVQVAQIAEKGLTQAISQAQAIMQANVTANPRLAAMARRAIAGYQRALKPHQQTLKQAAAENDRAKRQGVRDTAEQDAIDKRNKQKRDTLSKRAQAILDRRREAARVAKMTPKQRAAYGKAKSAQAKALHKAAEDKVLKEAGKA